MFTIESTAADSCWVKNRLEMFLPPNETYRSGMGIMKDLTRPEQHIRLWDERLGDLDGPDTFLTIASRAYTNRSYMLGANPFTLGYPRDLSDLPLPDASGMICNANKLLHLQRDFSSPERDVDFLYGINYGAYKSLDLLHMHMHATERNEWQRVPLESLKDDPAYGLITNNTKGESIANRLPEHLSSKPYAQELLDLHGTVVRPSGSAFVPFKFDIPQTYEESTIQSRIWNDTEKFLRDSWIAEGVDSRLFCGAIGVIASNQFRGGWMYANSAVVLGPVHGGMMESIHNVVLPQNPIKSDPEEVSAYLEYGKKLAAQLQ